MLGMPALLAACGPHLQHLKLCQPHADDPPIAQLLNHTPQLRSLELSPDHLNRVPPQVLVSDFAAIANLTSLTCLTAPKALYAALLCSRARGAAPGALGHLRRVRLQGVVEVEQLAAVLCSNLLSPGCEVVLDQECELELILLRWLGHAAARMAAVARSGHVRLHSQLCGGSLVSGVCSIGMAALTGLGREEKASIGRLLSCLDGLLVSDYRMSDQLLAVCSDIARGQQPPGPGTSTDAGTSAVAAPGAGTGALAGSGTSAGGGEPEGLWLLSAMPHMTSLALMANSTQNEELLGHLPAVITAGHLPNLSNILIVAADYPPNVKAVLKSLPPPGDTMLPAVARLLVARPQITIRWVPKQTAWGVQQLRTCALGLQDRMQPHERDTLLAWLLQQ